MTLHLYGMCEPYIDLCNDSIIALHVILGKGEVISMNKGKVTPFKMRKSICHVEDNSYDITDILNREHISMSAVLSHAEKYFSNGLQDWWDLTKNAYESQNNNFGLVRILAKMQQFLINKDTSHLAQDLTRSIDGTVFTAYSSCKLIGTGLRLEK